MVREKAKKLLELLQQGTGASTLFGNCYFDKDIEKLIEVIVNECKSTVRINGTERRYESNIPIDEIRRIVRQLLSDKNELINTTGRVLTAIPDRHIQGITKSISFEKQVSPEEKYDLSIQKPILDNPCRAIMKTPQLEERFLKSVIQPYVMALCKQDERLSKRHRWSRLFSLHRRLISTEELINRCQDLLKTECEDSKIIESTAHYIVYQLLMNESFKNEIIKNELQGKSLQVLSDKRKKGFDGMVSNISFDLLDILKIPTNPNAGLEELHNIYATIIGELYALSIEPGKDATIIEQQIKMINHSINTNRKEFYGTNGYRTVNVGCQAKDVGYTKVEHVEEAMRIYSQSVAELVQGADQMSKEEFIKKVATLHFRFIQIHPFPDGNGRTARAISNMLLLQKNLVAVFPKQNKPEYIQKMNKIRSHIQPEYLEALYTDPSKCEEMERKMPFFRLEDFIGMKCIDDSDVRRKYQERQTAKLPKTREP